jgi:hypothetical protein
MMSLIKDSEKAQKEPPHRRTEINGTKPEQKPLKKIFGSLGQRNQSEPR